MHMHLLMHCKCLVRLHAPVSGKELSSHSWGMLRDYPQRHHNLHHPPCACAQIFGSSHCLYPIDIPLFPLSADQTSQCICIRAWLSLRYTHATCSAECKQQSALCCHTYAAPSALTAHSISQHICMQSHSLCACCRRWCMNCARCRVSWLWGIAMV